MSDYAVEDEVLYTSQSDEIIEPFNPKDVDIIVITMTIANLIDRLSYDEIDLYPDFQRNGDLWDKVKQSRLIESLIIKIPLPAFYFDGADEDKYIVVDGLQRLSSIKHFTVDKDLKLEGLEYLQDLNGKTFDELSPAFQRRIREQNITAYVIRKGTPNRVRTSIFTRINTGGIQLNSAEIKNSIYRGPVANLLKSLAHTNEFVLVTRNKISPKRMLDCEFVNRFLAFYLLGKERYKGNLENFLLDVLDELTVSDQKVFNNCENAFLKSLRRCNEIFGDKAFRQITKNGKYGKINKPLFECITVSFAKLNDLAYSVILEKKDKFLDLYQKLLKDENFRVIISSGTASIESVNGRYRAIEKLFLEILND